MFKYSQSAFKEQPITVHGALHLYFVKGKHPETSIRSIDNTSHTFRLFATVLSFCASAMFFLGLISKIGRPVHIHGKCILTGTFVQEKLEILAWL